MAAELVRSFVRGSIIGAGGFGAVYLALNSMNGNLIVVKSVEYNCNGSWSASSDLQTLQNEISIFESIESPHIVQYLGSSKTFENEKWMLNLFLEYMPGGSLADIIDEFGDCLDESLVRTYTRGILQGLHYLHSNGITHCDLKGKNILLGCSGVKLADLGSAKRINVLNSKLCEKKIQSSSTKMIGTPLWMAPEVVRHEEQGSASDIWSLGCTIIEMATGKAPWPNLRNESPVIALYKIGSRDEIP